jgi:outer membrane receptor protein involved in Fe transport
LYKSRQFSDDANTEDNIIDAYTTFDLQLSRPITSWLHAMLDVQDVFNNQHMETQTYLSPGRLISLRLAVKF